MSIYSGLNATEQFAIQTGAEPHPFDVFARDDETVLIVECAHSKETGPKSVKQLLDKISGIREEIVKAIHTSYGKEPRLKVKFAIATRDIVWQTPDRAHAESKGVPIITEDDRKYFYKLRGCLGTPSQGLENGITNRI